MSLVTWFPSWLGKAVPAVNVDGLQYQALIQTVGTACSQMRHGQGNGRSYCPVHNSPIRANEQKIVFQEHRVKLDVHVRFPVVVAASLSPIRILREMTFQERNSHIGVTPNDREPSNERSLGSSNRGNQGEIPKERPEHTTFHFKVDVLA